MRTDDAGHIFQCQAFLYGNGKFADHVGGTGAQKLGADDHMAVLQIDHFYEAAFLGREDGFSIGGADDLMAFGRKPLGFGLIQRQSCGGDLRTGIDAG